MSVKKSDDLKKQINALVIVAHPDDETIWMGGTILKNKDWKWNIICLSRMNDVDRKPRFLKVCEHYRAKCVINDLEDESLTPLSIKDVEEKIIECLKKINKKEFDYVFTHGKNGEYGHLRHKEVHMAVKSLISKNILKSKNYFYFSYNPSDSTFNNIHNINVALPNKKADYVVNLDRKVLKDKINLVVDKYGFDKKSFEAVSCNIVEAFNKK